MKKILIILLCTLLLCACRKEELNGIADCVNSFESENFYHLSIIANQEEINDKEEYALHLIEKVINNDFHTILFSYDIKGFPQGVEMNVYLTEEDKQNGNLFMTVRFTQEDRIKNNYNIADDYDKFNLEIR